MAVSRGVAERQCSDARKARVGREPESRRRGLAAAPGSAQVRVLLSLQQSAGNGAVARLVQRKKVSDDHVAADLNHKQQRRLFTGKTLNWWDALPDATKTPASTNGAASVAAGRENVDYEQLRNTTLKSAQGLFTWLGTDAEEYMYVHSDNNIYTGGRDREKLPHPTLVGGDPDATCAGTMLLDNSKKKITVTNESGHFRPKSVPSETLEFVRSILPKPAKGKRGYKVEAREY
jgi:hypothetical protein